MIWLKYLDQERLLFQDYALITMHVPYLASQMSKNDSKPCFEIEMSHIISFLGPNNSVRAITYELTWNNNLF
jgi:hypothetical protein